MALPDNAVLLEATWNNLLKQFSEDALKRTTLTDTDRYNQWVSTINGLAEADRFDPPQTPAAVMDYTNGGWAARGYAGVDTIINAQEPNWNVEVWPIPLA